MLQLEKITAMIILHFHLQPQFTYELFQTMLETFGASKAIVFVSGRVVRKPVNADPGLKVDRGKFFFI